MIEIQKLYQKGLEIPPPPDSIISLTQLRGTLRSLYTSHRDAGAQAGMFLHLGCGASEKLHVGVSSKGVVIIYVLCEIPLACMAIMHAAEQTTFEEFEILGEVDSGCLHPFDEATEAIWSWGATGRMHLYLRSCLDSP